MNFISDKHGVHKYFVNICNTIEIIDYSWYSMSLISNEDGDLQEYSGMFEMQLYQSRN